MILIFLTEESGAGMVVFATGNLWVRRNLGYSIKVSRPFEGAYEEGILADSILGYGLSHLKSLPP